MSVENSKSRQVTFFQIAICNVTFHQEHQGSHIQSNGNNNLKHSLHHLLLQS